MLHLNRTLRSVNWVSRVARMVLMIYRRWYFGLKDVHATFYMAKGCSIPSTLVAKEYSFINIGCVLDSKVEIGRYSMLAPYVAIVGRDHVFSSPGTPIIFSGRPTPKETTIEDDAWIGFGAIIMAGTRIGRGAIVGAGSVVTKDIPPFEIHAGVPAKKIGERFPNPEDRAKHAEMLSGSIFKGEFCSPPSD